MRPSVGICTDSGSQLPHLLLERFAIEVVPLTVTVDGVDHLEGVDIDADSFYEHFAGGHQPVVTTAPPSPGQFAVAFEDLIERGCTEILSVHGTSAVAATINSARLAVHSTPVPIRLVDSGTAGFGTACSVWAAADALAGGASLDDAARIAEELARSIGSAFLWGNRGRLGRPVLGCDGDVAVLTRRNDRVEELQRFPTTLEAVNAMAAHAIRWGDRLKVGVGHSDAASAPLGDALEVAIGEAANVLEVVRYRVGPSVGAHTGPGSAGCVMFPVG